MIHMTYFNDKDRDNRTGIKQNRDKQYENDVYIINI